MSEATLDDFVATAELTIVDWNTILNALNAPGTTPVIVNWNCINILQQQIGPQIEKAKAALDAVKAANGKTLKENE